MALNRDDARSIAKKLRAETVERGGAHDLAVIYYEGKIIAKFGIRRGSRDLGHDYIPGEIYTSPRKAADLANCPRSYEEWVQEMKDKGNI